jgi:hypothetical protein
MFINFRHLIYINHIVAHSWIYIPMLSPFISFIKNVPITSCNCIICITHAIKNHIYIRANIIKHTYIYIIYILYHALTIPCPMTSTLIAQNNRHRQVTLCIPLAARSAGLTARRSEDRGHGQGPRCTALWGCRVWCKAQAPQAPKAPKAPKA